MAQKSFCDLVPASHIPLPASSSPPLSYVPATLAFLFLNHTKSNMLTNSA